MDNKRDLVASRLLPRELGKPRLAKTNDGFSLADFLDALSQASHSRLRLVKDSPHRKVLFFDHCFLKLFYLKGMDRIALRDPAKKEYELARILMKRRRTAMPLAYLKGRGWSLFISKEIEEGVELADFLKRSWPGLCRKERQVLSKRFIEFLSDLAELGIFQPDFHLNNLLYEASTGRFVLIDLHRAMHLGRPLTPVEQMEQLRYILPPLSRYLSATDLLRATSMLSKRLPHLHDSSARAFLVDLAFKDMRENWRKKVARRRAAYTRRSRINNLTLLSRASTEEEIIERMANIFSHLACNRGDLPGECTILKDSRHTLCLRLSHREQSFFVKIYRSSSHLKGLSYLIRRPRAIRVWNAAWQLFVRDIPTPMPILALQGANPWGRIYGLVLYPWLEGIREFDREVSQLLQEDNSQTRLFIKRLAMFIYQMHQRGVFHGDCKITNFFYESSTGEILTFDLDAMRFSRQVKESQRVKDVYCMFRSLRRLSGTSTDFAQIFLSHYCFFYYPWRTKGDYWYKRMEAMLSR